MYNFKKQLCIGQCFANVHGKVVMEQIQHMWQPHVVFAFIKPYTSRSHNKEDFVETSTWFTSQ